MNDESKEILNGDQLEQRDQEIKRIADVIDGWHPIKIATAIVDGNFGDVKK